MNAQYLIRLDDACPTMRREIWDPLEAALDKLGIRPIVGVIPDNHDISMHCSPIDPDFWTRMRNWDKKGWTIALHGLHHTYHEIPENTQALIPIHRRSEFVGLDLAAQRELFKVSWALFKQNGITPTVFMAPSHTFDAITLEALKLETDIRIITDGYALNPYLEHDFVWVPQQLWRYRKLPFGVWTICLHPNVMTVSQVESFIKELTFFVDKIVVMNEIIPQQLNRKGIADNLFARLFGLLLKAKQGMSA